MSGLDDVPLPGLGGAPSMRGSPTPGGGTPGGAGGGGGAAAADSGEGLVVGASAAAGRPGYGAVSGGDIFLAADGSGVVSLQLQLGAGALCLSGRCRAALVLGPGSGAQLLSVCRLALSFPLRVAIAGCALTLRCCCRRRRDVHVRGGRPFRAGKRLALAVVWRFQRKLITPTVTVVLISSCMNLAFSGTLNSDRSS